MTILPSVILVVFMGLAPSAAAGSAPDTLGPCPWPGPAAFLADRPSPPDSVVFELGGAVAKVCYGRPAARGRVVFGELVRWGRVWRTGANEPTTLHLPVAAEVAGVAVGPGTYIVLTVPSPEAWTVVLNTSDATDPARMLTRLTEVGRGEVPVERLDAHVEVFTIRATDTGGAGGAGATPGVAGGGADLLLEWERVRARVPIRVHETP